MEILSLGRVKVNILACRVLNMVSCTAKEKKRRKQKTIISELASATVIYMIARYVRVTWSGAGIMYFSRSALKSASIIMGFWIIAEKKLCD